MAKEKYDDLPYEWTFGDPKRIWQAQISGEKNFEACSFMGALNDLQSDPNWREAFKGIENCTGMREFMGRLQGHFDLCNPARSWDGSFHVYQHPSRTNSPKEFNQEIAVSLAKRHINTIATAYRRDDREEEARRLLSFPIIWTDDADAFFALGWREQLDARDGRPAGFYLHDSWSFEFNDSEYWNARVKEGAPDIWGELEESAYSMANDYGLQRYLMQSFLNYDLDVDARYELEWVHNCICYFDETKAYVIKNRKN